MINGLTSRKHKELLRIIKKDTNITFFLRAQFLKRYPQEKRPSDYAHIWKDTQLVIKGTEIKTTVKYFYTSTTMAKIPNELSYQVLIKIQSNWNLICCALECKLVKLLWKTLHCQSYNPAIPLWGMYLRKMNVFVHQKTCSRMFIILLFIITKY